MPANYLHGVETIEVERGARPVRVVKSAVVGLVGCAAFGPVNQPTLVLSDLDNAQFGKDMPGFSITQALDAIQDQGAGTVVVVNVLDFTKHNSSITAESVVFNHATDTAKLEQYGVRNLVLKKDATALVEGTDYSFDAKANKITRLSGSTIGSGDTVTASYNYADPSKITPADIIGGLDDGGVRVGLQSFKDCYNLFGFSPKILIAPGYSSLKAVSTEMGVMSKYLGAIDLIDAPVGTTLSEAIKGRGPVGSINFNTSSERTVLCYPHCKVYDSSTGGERLEPLSQRLAGAIAAKDIEKGFHFSPSNTEIQGITGSEFSLTAKIDDPQSEVNLLNEVGVCTIFNSYGTGFRTWGNRSAAWPSNTHMKNFICVRRTADIINESIRYFSLQYMDSPINQALVDDLVESVNSFLRKLVGDGALIGGKCWFDTSRNPKEQLASGQLLLQYKFTPPTPLERLTFETEITDEYLVSLRGSSSLEAING